MKRLAASTGALVMLFLVLTVGVLLLSLVGDSLASAPPATPLEKTVAYVQPSIVYLDIEWTGWVYDKYNKQYLKDGKPFVLHYSCTGFVVNPDGYIATAGHAVDKRNVAPDFIIAAAKWALKTGYYRNKTLKLADIVGDYRVEGNAKGAGGSNYTAGADLKILAVWSTSSTEPLYDKYGDLNGAPHGARIVHMLPWNDGSGDVALLKVDASDLPGLPVATSGSVSTGTQVVSVGYPATVGTVSDASLSNPSFKEGSISSIRTSGTYPLYETSAALSGGMSGGPTVNLQGSVVGVNSYTISGEVQSFDFVQAAETLQGVMSDAGVPAEVGEVGTAYRAGLDAYYAGNKAKAIKQFNAALAIDPKFDMAREFLVKAQELPTPPPHESGNSMILITVGAVLALLLGVVGYFVIRRRNRASAALAPKPAPALAGVGFLPGSRRTATAPTPQTLQAVAKQDELVPSFCSYCGNRIEDSAASFCARCGHATSAAAEGAQR